VIALYQSTFTYLLTNVDTYRWNISRGLFLFKHTMLLVLKFIFYCFTVAYNSIQKFTCTAKYEKKLKGLFFPTHPVDNKG